MLEVKDLTKIYTLKQSKKVVALNRIHLSFPNRGLVFVLGKSGSGKSTLLHILGGLDTLSGGEMFLDGRSCSDFTKKDWDDYRNECVGFVFQTYNLLPDFTVGENIGLALQLLGERVTEERIASALDQVGLSDFQKRKPAELSGGQQQRVAVARALVKNPKILFADEPTGALDEETGASILALLKEVSRDRLVIVVSHDRDFARQYADRIIELSEGEVISDYENRP